jgi:hypothetical protein
VRPANAMLTFSIATDTPREQRWFSAAISLELKVAGKMNSLSRRLIRWIPAQPVTF